jgi:hypothetical protein
VDLCQPNAVEQAMIGQGEFIRKETVVGQKRWRAAKL